MISPRSLDAMIEASRFEEMKAAIVSRLGTLMPGIRVVSHPGKLDIVDVVKKDVVAAPGVAIGWTRIRAPREVAGGYQTPIDWAAYIVAEDKADLAAKRKLSREAVAHGIGSFLLEILHDEDAPSWDLGSVTMPFVDPPPELRPVFTANAYEAGTAYYAVTWTQAIVDEGRPYFVGSTPVVDVDTGTLVFAEGEKMPPELVALIGDIVEGEV